MVLMMSFITAAAKQTRVNMVAWQHGREQRKNLYLGTHYFRDALKRRQQVVGASQRGQKHTHTYFFTHIHIEASRLV